MYIISMDGKLPEQFSLWALDKQEGSAWICDLRNDSGNHQPIAACSVYRLRILGNMQQASHHSTRAQGATPGNRHQAAYLKFQHHFNAWIDQLTLQIKDFFEIIGESEPHHPSECDAAQQRIAGIEGTHRNTGSGF